MKAVILAGGKGSRLGELSENIPKPMIEIAGKPLLQYQIDLCARYGIQEVILIVNHLKDVIISYFGDGEKFGIPITYFEEPRPLGTVGGIKEIEYRLKDDFLVLYGDVMMDMNLPRLIEFHRQKESEATLVVHPNDHPHDSDLLEMDENDRISKFIPKPHEGELYYHNMVNAAVYVLTPGVLKHLKKGEKADFGRDIFPSLSRHIRMFGYNTPEYLKDMGTPERLKEVETDVISGKVKRRNLENKQLAIYLDRDGVLNRDIDLIHKTDDLQLYPFSSSALRKINNTDYLAVLVTNQSVVARNLTTIEGLQEIHKKLETELGHDGAKLDAIYFCPHHPDKGYPEENPKYKIECECRKPKPGMMMEAAERFNIDNSRSWMIGDSERDILAGKAANCTTVGVMTGQGVKESTIHPDYFFENLSAAVDFIVDEPYESEAKALLKGLPDKAPFVIAIGGNSRSGKSTFSTYLQKKLEAEGISCVRIQLDHWIKPADERIFPHDVFDNYNSESLVQDLQSIQNGGKVSLDAYSAHPSAERQNITYKYNNEQVIIIEGVIALAHEGIRKLADKRVFMKISTELQKERIYTFYRWKGMEVRDIHELWQQRNEREYRLIAKSEKWADIVI